MISGSIPMATTQKIRLFISILSVIDQEYGKFITLISKEVRRTVGTLDTSIANSDIIRFVNLESVLNDLLDALVPTNAALQNLLSGKLLTLYEEDKDFVEDVYLANGQLIELSRANLRTIVNVRNAYSTIMTNTLNRVIKLLTGLTIVITVPTIIINLYGMNVPLPFQESAHAFWIIMMMTASVTALAVWFFIRKKWL
jgi:magnesium transporter